MTGPQANDLFDEVLVLSLPGADERRAYVTDHLRAHGISDFSFFDASAADSPETDAAYADGLVATYPPCFRCGKTSCGRPDCNNVLIAPQVATFVSYLRLWRHIAARRGCFLVLEDDVKLHANWQPALNFLAEMRGSKAPWLDASQPRLLRLGWALCAEHDESREFAIRQDVRMSNPCHAITSAFATALLDRFRTICVTVDTFMHRDAPLDGEAWTLFPPVASELSWSTGALASQIHPKLVRSDYLAQRGLLEEAAEAERQARHHARHIAHREPT